MAVVLGVDYGTRRLGLAVSEPDGIIALPLKTVAVRTPAEALNAVVEAAAETEAERIVVGMPRNMDGTHGPAAVAVDGFVGALRDTVDLPVETLDERLTTKMAERTLRETSARRGKRKQVIDQLAAQIILQDYLDGEAEGAPPW